MIQASATPGGTGRGETGDPGRYRTWGNGTAVRHGDQGRYRTWGNGTVVRHGDPVRYRTWGNGTGVRHENANRRHGSSAKRLGMRVREGALALVLVVDGISNFAQTGMQ